jgi:ABC-type nitrate/sulfonate/bicarbonate transport system ATPase subunit
MMTVNIANKSYYRDGAAAAVIQDLAFEVKTGEFLAIVGPSGAGKSTMLNLIAGVDTKFDGRISHSNSNTGSPKLGIMFQEPRLMPWLTLLENVCLVSDSPKSTLTAVRAEAMLNTVGIAASSAQYPSQLSGGMQRRVALARALMSEPDVLLLDEPLVSLDQPAAMELRQLLLTVWQKHKFTIVYVTHQLEEAITMADRILFLSATPTKIIREECIDLPRPRQLLDVDALRISLCDREGLLSGRLG